MALLEITQRASDRLPRGTDELRHLLVGQGNLHANDAVDHTGVRGPLQQEARKFFGNGMRQANRPNDVVGGLAVASQMFRSTQASIGMLIHEAEKVVPPDECKLGGLQGFNRNFVRPAADDRMQAKNRSWLDNLQNEALTVGIGGHHFRAALAKDVDTARVLTFHENDRAFREAARVLNLI